MVASPRFLAVSRSIGAHHSGEPEHQSWQICTTDPACHHRDIISQEESMKSLCRSQFPHKYVNVFFALVVKNKNGQVCAGIGFLQNDLMNTFCERR